MADVRFVQATRIYPGTEVPAKYVYDYMFATILVFVAVAFVCDRCAVSVGRRLLRWHAEAETQ